MLFLQLDLRVLFITVPSAVNAVLYSHISDYSILWKTHNVLPSSFLGKT